MDRYLTFENINQTVKSLHLIGITCIFISCKYEEQQPISVETLCDKICNKKFSKMEIIEKEADVLKVLKFNITKTTIIDAMGFMIKLFESTLKLCQSKI